ncbi:MAG: two-component regulator propeller domain-containing protein [Bacteroidota bacterium]
MKGSKHTLTLAFLIAIIFVITFCSFGCGGTEPQEKNIDPLIKKWTIYNQSNSGLPSNEISTIAVDNLGRVWVGTYNEGLAKLEGGSCIIYNTNNSGLSNNSINCIAVGTDNNIWIGTSNGLTKYDGKNWIVYNTENSPLPYRIIRVLTFDKNNLLWVGCGHFTAGGILSLNGSSWKLYTKDNSLLPSSIIDVIHVDKNNNKWVGTAGGLVKIDDLNTWNVFTPSNSGLLKFGINAITTDNNNDVWIGAREWERLDYEHYYGLLQKFDGKNWVDFRPHPNGIYNLKAITSNRVAHIICDRFDYLLIATETEWRYPHNLSFFKNGIWKNLSDIANGLSINLFIRDMKLDKNGTLWLATQYGVISIEYAYN